MQGVRETLARWRIRAHMASPRWIRTAYRVAGSVGRNARSRPLPPGLVENCRCCRSRYDLLDHLPKNGVVMEVGTQRGDFARAIVERTAPKELHLVDIDYTLFDAQDLGGDFVTRHCGMSHEVVASFTDAYFDWIYIDADHSYEAALRDANAAAAKVKPGGFLVFNDFAHIDAELGRYGVHRAVTDFVLEHKWPFALFAFSPDALYDVALQKPAR